MSTKRKRIYTSRPQKVEVKRKSDMSRRLRDEFERLYNPLTKKHRNINLDKYVTA